MKMAIIKELILALPDHTKSYEVQTDAFNFAIGGVLIQDGHLVAFKNQRLNEIERRYTIHEKEMIAVVHYFRT